MIEELLLTVRQAQEDPSALARLAAISNESEKWTPEDVAALFGELQEISSRFKQQRSEGTYAAEQTAQVIVEAITRWQKLNPDSTAIWNPENLEHAKTVYLASAEQSNLRNHILAALATGANTEAIEQWSELLVDHPPQHRSGIRLAFGPLMKKGSGLPRDTMQRLLLKATPHLQIAPAVYELLNYYVRVGELEEHPAEERAGQLTTLLGQLVGQLSRIEEGNVPADSDPKEIGQQVTDSALLIVALIDTLGLIEHKDAVGKINQALELKHRRIQTEAAAALARMGEENGEEALLALAEEPSVRLRVLAYAEEIGIDKKISLELRGEIARAESQLAIWLSEPSQIGIAPTEVNLIDNREFNWPSYEHPIQCYLFNFRYGQSENAYGNVGICGPLTHSFAADIKHLSVEDMYAAFAGWQTVHAEIFLSSIERAQQLNPKAVGKLIAYLEESSEDGDPKIESVASFFGVPVLIVSTQRDSGPGTLLIDLNEQGEVGSQFIEQGNPAAPIDWQLAFSIWQGRRLLKSFNS